MPYYHHELVKRALVMAADDSKGHDSPLLLKLLSELASSGAINQAGHMNAVGVKKSCTDLDLLDLVSFLWQQMPKDTDTHSLAGKHGAQMRPCIVVLKSMTLS